MAEIFQFPSSGDAAAKANDRAWQQVKDHLSRGLLQLGGWPGQGPIDAAVDRVRRQLDQMPAPEINVTLPDDATKEQVVAAFTTFRGYFLTVMVSLILEFYVGGEQAK